MTREKAQNARRAFAVAAATLAAVGCGSVATQSTHQTAASASPQGTTTSTPSRDASSTTGALPSAGTVAATISSVGPLQSKDDTDSIAVDAGSVWVDNGETGIVSRIDARTNRIVATIKLSPGCAAGRGCGDIAAADGAVWVASDSDGSVTRIDERTNAVVAHVVIGATAGPLVYAAPGQVWTANYFTDSFSRIDTRTNAVVSTVRDHVGAQAVAFDGGSLWLCDAGDNPAVTRVNPATLRVEAQLSLSGDGAPLTCLGAAAHGGTVAVAAGDGQSRPTIQLVDAASAKVTAATDLQGTGFFERSLAAGPDGTWVVDSQTGLIRLDPHTAGAMAALSLQGAVAVADDAGSVWVVDASGVVTRVTPVA